LCLCARGQRRVGHGADLPRGAGECRGLVQLGDQHLEYSRVSGREKSREGGGQHLGEFATNGLTRQLHSVRCGAVRCEVGQRLACKSTIPAE